jgi:hypothetical protein
MSGEWNFLVWKENFFAAGSLFSSLGSLGALIPRLIRKHQNSKSAEQGEKAIGCSYIFRYLRSQFLGS